MTSFICQGPESKYFRFGEPRGLCLKCSAASWCESRHRRDLNRRARLRANGTPSWPLRRGLRIMFASRGSAFFFCYFLPFERVTPPWATQEPVADWTWPTGRRGTRPPEGEGGGQEVCVLLCLVRSDPFPTQNRQYHKCPCDDKAQAAWWRL